MVGRLLIALASVALVAAVGEIVARVTSPEASVRETDLGSELPLLRGRQLERPNVRGIHNGVLFRTNSQGLRGPELPLEAEPGTFRIAVVGDSVAMGSGVEEAATYAARLAAMLDAARPGRRHEVLNFGLAGLDIEGIVARLERLVEIYRPQLVVYGFTVNDIEGPAYRRAAPDGAIRDFMLRMARFYDSPSYLWRWVWTHAVSLRERLVPTMGVYHRELEDNYLHNPAAWQRFAAGLDALAELSRVSGTCVEVLVHTHLTGLRGDHPYLPIYRLVERASRERGLYAAQSYDHFAGENDGDLWVRFNDPHPNDRGHELLAQALLSGLLALPTHCWDHPV